MGDATYAERFWSHVDRRADDECWSWDRPTPSGYGRFKIAEKMFYAHRIAYELLVGPIPEGLQLDHLCRQRSCCNPTHLEPVTNRVNSLRSNNVGAIHAAVTHCPAGHPYDDDNTYRYPDGRRGCRACRHDRNVAYRRRKGQPQRRFSTETHCKEGHPWTAETLYVVRVSGQRRCRVCTPGLPPPTPVPPPGG
jgi:hypothetical protein